MTDVSSLEIVLLLICFIGSGFFSGSEAVLLSIPHDRASQLIQEGGAKGRAIAFMIDRPSEILTTILVGNNVVNIFASSLTTVLATRLFADDAIGIAVGATTFVILIFGEIIPKTFARTHAESLSLFVIRVLQIFYYLLYPVIKIMVWLIHTVLGENAQLTGRIVTKDDLEFMIQKAEKENTIDHKQIDLFNSILEFPKIKVKDIMIPRKEIKSIQVGSTYKEVISEIEESIHSRYPVVDGEIDNIEGFLHVKELAFLKRAERDNFTMVNHLRDPFFVYEHMKIQAVFDHMNRKKVHMALVKDENGLIVGIITLEDIIEEILGEIQDEHDDDIDEITKDYHESDLIEGADIDGATNLRDLDHDYDIKIPLNDNYSTLAGFLLDMLGNNFPEAGQIIIWEGYSFELTEVFDYEIKQVKIKDVDGEKHFFSKKEAKEATETSDDLLEVPVK
ncbi:hemolysin family protein [Halobacteriovorax sp. ZH4_bin.1]|uniref:hemolysin family protein n=1 Tax=unclassified Halobacteriovorax TaxID=2639665 RepID=UPI003723ADEE